MVCGVFQQIKSIYHSSFLYENSDFPAFFPATFSSRVCHQGAYRFGSPVLYVPLCTEFTKLGRKENFDTNLDPDPEWLLICDMCSNTK